MATRSKTSLGNKKAGLKKKASRMQVTKSALNVNVEEVEKKEEKETHGEGFVEALIINQWKPPLSDDEDTTAEHYNVAEAWRSLRSLPSCQPVYIKEKEQRRLQILIGVNVSQEFPWKQIQYKVLVDYLDEIEEGDIVHTALKGFNPENHLLVGYAPLLTQNEENPPEGDPFIIFLNPNDTKKALAIIQNIEHYERWVINKRLLKKPRRWVSLGSENEVNMTIEQRFTSPLDVEIQSVYPLTIPKNKEFSFRKSADVRDGYVELLPSENVKFENVTRRRITMGIQSAPKLVHVEQQTNPTFPANAWAQYLYEIIEDEGLDNSSEDEATKEQLSRASKTPTPASIEPPTPKPPPEMSSQIKLLLDTLEFNQIDMYRNDYVYIYGQPIEHYTTPYLKETLCFANITKSYERYVCGIDWYPNLSGLIVTSYTFNTSCTIDLITSRADVVQRAVLQPNPILMWSFADNLNYKLEFESSQEVTVLSFCPHDPNLMFGGAKNGQLILWDLQGRAEKLDTEEVLTAAQAKYRVLIADFLKWTIQINEDSIVSPVAISALEVSQKSTITGIYWMGKHFFLNTFGKAYIDLDSKNTHKFFATCALDGTISFWDLDSTHIKKQQGGAVKRDQPKELILHESAYKNRILKPMFTVVFYEPLTSIVCDTSVFSCVVLDPAIKRKNKMNFPTKLEPKDPEEMRQSAITSSFYGRIERINWLGSYADADGREYSTPALSFARVHDGPVIAMRKNPFYPLVFVSIGRNVFAVWKENYNYSPIFWRKRPTDLTAVAWSEARPGVLFITRIDGNLEVWDILARDDDACYNDILGGGIVTAISEHRPADPEKLLGIGDYNSSFRMVRLPQSFYEPELNELQRVKNYFKKEEQRKVSIQVWEHKFFEQNRDIIEAKREAEIEARKEIERIEKENAINATRKVKEETTDDNDELKHLSYTERMKRKWDELNLNRMLMILMSRKRVNEEQLERETRLEKRHLAYEAAKKASLARIQQRIGEEIATVRSRILPHEKVDLQRIDMILSSVRELMETVETYSEVEEEANAIINNFEEFDTISYIDFLHRGNHRRRLLINSIGGNIDRLYWYENAEDENLLEQSDWGYNRFVTSHSEYLTKKENSF